MKNTGYWLNGLRPKDLQHLVVVGGAATWNVRSKAKFVKVVLHLACRCQDPAIVQRMSPWILEVCLLCLRPEAGNRKPCNCFNQLLPRCTLTTNTDSDHC